MPLDHQDRHFNQLSCDRTSAAHQFPVREVSTLSLALAVVNMRDQNAVRTCPFWKRRTHRSDRGAPGRNQDAGLPSRPWRRSYAWQGQTGVSKTDTKDLLGSDS